jgi:hypothetical protein
MKRTKVLAAALGTVLAVGALSACSSADEAASAPASAIDAAESAVAATDQAAMEELCNQMVSAGMSPEEATALAEDNGYIARVGTIDGQPQAVTMDFREDRFTFDVSEGAVIACTYG